MMKQARYLVIILAPVIALASCKKDDKAKSKSELLTTGSWHVVAYTVDPAVDWDGDGNAEANVYEVIDPCSKDDKSTFYTGGNGQLDEGATKCDANDPQTVPFTWSLSQDENHLTVEGVEYLLESLTDRELVVKQIEVVSSTTYTHRVTFSH